MALNRDRKHFYFGSPSDSDSDLEDLPFAQPLARASFLTPDFTPQGFLSSLHDRHQTLEDLRAELRTRSQELSKELLDLVNDNYEEFLGLGEDLKGGYEKVEEIMVGLIKFRREIEEVRDVVNGRKAMVEELIEERRGIKKELRRGRELLALETGIEELEDSLGIRTHEEKNGIDANGRGLHVNDDSEESEDGTTTTISMSMLRQRTQQLAKLLRMTANISPDHPFLVRHRDRLAVVKQTTLLDLSAGLKQYSAEGGDGGTKALQVLQLYRLIGEQGAAINAVKVPKS